MKDDKTYTTPPAAIMEKIHSPSVQAMTEYYSKGMIGGCSNLARPHVYINKKLVDCVTAKNCSQTELP